MGIFQDTAGQPLKFFIQKDLPQQTQSELCESITSLGGRVEAKVPRQGYVLVHPGTQECERLRACWHSPDRPERHFVAYTFVDACKISGQLIQQIFVKEGTGEPMKMHIHSSIGNVNVRNVLSNRILHSGGDPYATLQTAQVILADPNTEVFKQLVKMFQSSPDKYIESWLWVKQCAERGILSFTPLVYKNPGGRRAGEERTQFTEDDEQRLCEWIAAKIPYKSSGGRTGNRLYMQLVEQDQDTNYQWVTRHTWQSWRERYKKHAHRLDAHIDAIVQQKKPVIGERGQYGYVRQRNEVEVEREGEGEVLVPPSQTQKPKRKTAGRKGKGKEVDIEEKLLEGRATPAPLVGAQQLDDAHLTAVDVMLRGWDHIVPPTSSLPLHQHRQGVPSSSKMDGGEEDDESQWPIRIGNDPLPSWAPGAKRVREESSDSVDDGDVEGPRDQKRFRPMMEVVGHINPLEGLTPINSENKYNGAEHIIDKNIRDIATETMFTIEEVQAYYDRCGEMNKTQNRFRRMRTLLEEHFKGDDD